MTRLVWDAPGQRFFETGVDQGVLYVGGTGVAWNGLLSVTESPSGGDVKPYYVDGIKYLNVSSAEEFEATIEAYTYPDEFDPCVGVAPVSHGLSANQQPRSPFSMCYRTRVGNDLEGANHGYKIHLVYNATAAPSNKGYKSMSDTVDPFNFSWKIVTKPPTFIGYKPTAHFTIDSRDTPLDLMQQISDILYGSSTTAPRIPSVPELLSIFNDYEAAFYDAGHIGEEYFLTFDAGRVGDPYTAMIDGGTP